MPERHAPLEIDQDLVFQRREWRVQRVGWWALCLFVVAALAGVFGEGPISRTRAEGTGLSAEYDRFIRTGRPTRLTASWSPAGGEASLRLDRAYFDRVRLEQVTPAPLQVEIGASDVRLRFAAGGARPFTVVVEIEPLGAARLATELRTESGHVTRIVQLAYF
ncbi:MAG TPA: hypothetical protein VD833_06185 [Vicinamibacterales bacterium]|nr:hypothetical protein [Vicinamibacterales bacterium]